jgi:hypothetical protein
MIGCVAVPDMAVVMTMVVRMIVMRMVVLMGHGALRQQHRLILMP